MRILALGNFGRREKQETRKTGDMKWRIPRFHQVAVPIVMLEVLRAKDDVQNVYSKNLASQTS